MKITMLAASLLFAATASGARMSDNVVRYTISFPAPQTHYMEVEASYPTGGEKTLEVMMPVWSPGSYLVREYARNVENVSAANESGTKLAVTKSRKNRWRITTGGAPRVTFRYRVYGREMRVQTNFIDADFAMIHGPATFITPVKQLQSPHEVRINLPANWQKAVSGMDEPSANRFTAPNFDILVDSPISVGNPAVHEFAVDGIPHYLVNIGGEQFWDGPRAARDTKKIVEQHMKIFGKLPYRKYVFFNYIVDAGGGLEHLNSTVLMTRRFQMRTNKTYVDWLELVSHEHFHVWNVKRLRPIELGPFDYENEVYTENLWIAEGFTAYYDKLQVARAGFMTADEYLEHFSKDIETLQTTPGRLVQSAETASFDAWIKAYRPDENSANTAISYYTKGSMIAFNLDGRIRSATSGAKSLDDVMRLAYERFSGERGYTSKQFLDVVSTVGGKEVAAWLDRATSTTEELDYSVPLGVFGLEFKKEEQTATTATTTVQPDKGEQDAPATEVRDPRGDKEPKGWFGATTKNDGGRIIVTVVRRETPAFAAGLNVDDEVIAIDGVRVTPDQWESRFEQYRPGERVQLTIARRGKLRELPATLGTEPPKVWKLQMVKEPSEAQKQNRQTWLNKPEPST